MSVSHAPPTASTRQPAAGHLPGSTSEAAATLAGTPHAAKMRENRKGGTCVPVSVDSVTRTMKRCSAIRGCWRQLQGAILATPNRARRVASQRCSASCKLRSTCTGRPVYWPYANSGDTCSSRQEVVGYGAVAFMLAVDKQRAPASSNLLSIRHPWAQQSGGGCR